MHRCVQCRRRVKLGWRVPGRTARRKRAAAGPGNVAMTATLHNPACRNNLPYTRPKARHNSAKAIARRVPSQRQRQQSHHPRQLFPFRCWHGIDVVRDQRCGTPRCRADFFSSRAFRPGRRSDAHVWTAGFRWMGGHGRSTRYCENRQVAQICAFWTVLRLITILDYRDRASGEAAVRWVRRSIVAVRVCGRWDGGVRHCGDGACVCV